MIALMVLGRWSRCVAAGRATAVGLLMVTVGCTPGSPSGQPAEPTSTALEVRFDTAELMPGSEEPDRASTAAAETEVGDLLSGYVVSGFLGDYPREDWVQAFNRFTGGAASDAVGDIEMLTGERYSRAREVRATRLVAVVSPLWADEGYVGATARVSFQFEVDEGSATRAFALEGRFMLGRLDGEWVVFGYDVRRDDGGATVGGTP